LRGKGEALRTAAVVYDPASGRELTVATNMRGMQFYTGNFLDGVGGRGGRVYRKHAGLCLETGAFPNQVNMDGEAQEVVLRPGESYRQRTSYRVSVR
jgi:aldose 1-epimerase